MKSRQRKKKRKKKKKAVVDVPKEEEEEEEKNGEAEREGGVKVTGRKNKMRGGKYVDEMCIRRDDTLKISIFETCPWFERFSTCPIQTRLNSCPFAYHE
jgi:hypothetical protein